MSRSIDEIRSSLDELVAKWADYQGTERSASQTFLNQLVAAYTGSSDAMQAGARFEEFGSRDEGSGFMDLYWPDVVIVEMKAPKESRRLDQHRAQALDYWRNSADQKTGVAAPPYLVLCSIKQFEIWQPGKFPTAPVDSFPLSELSDRAEALLFLAGRKPIFGGPGAHVTAQAAEHMVSLYFSLLDRRAAEPEELRRFVVQTVWTLFAEDIGLLEGKPLESLMRALLEDQSRSTSVELTDLYRRLDNSDKDRRNRGRKDPLPYVNGDLFKEAAEVHLEPSELQHLLAASVFDWRYVNPTVFGSLLEGCLGQNHRWELGAHYTSEIDIMTIVDPVIVRPWVEQIESAATLKDANALLETLCAFKVLDPAMGCGNFLSVAYREIRKLELRLHDRIIELAASEGHQPPLGLGWYPIHNIQGVEIDPFAVEIAKVTLWMTHAIESKRNAQSESPLPLPTLDSLICADSLKTDWPETDAIIGNPPFHGDRNLRGVLGDDYIDWLKSEFNVGVKDHCVYFFIKTHRNLRPGHRAGLVATKTISQAKNRDASLVWITETGGVITDAISTKPWSGEAKVHVSIVCWTKTPPIPTDFILDGIKVEGISPSLKPGAEHRKAVKLKPNGNVCYQGYLTRGMGFVLDNAEAESILSAHPECVEVIAPFINGEDTVRSVNQSPSRWVIDFADMPLDAAERLYPTPMKIVRDRVIPERAHDPKQMERWWQFWRPRPELRESLRNSLGDLDRFAIASRVGKRLLLVWAQPNWRPSDACNVFVFSDDYNFGVVISKTHDVWARVNSSTLKGDLRYSPSSAFETFPFPSPTDVQRERIAAASREIVDARKSACETNQIGLTKVYNLMGEGGFVDLKRAHEELDRAVMDAYGWPVELLDSPTELLDRLYDLNEACSKDSTYEPFPRPDSTPSLLDEM